jgi:pyrroloquinoline quinone (PQQ) biosynthesis protein C
MWQEGALSTADIAIYADQYRYFEHALPEVLLATCRSLGKGDARELVESNLRDELCQPEPHIELFDRFSEAVGATGETAASQATSRLVNLYRSSVAAGPVASLSVIAAYEMQAATIASTKSEALRSHHGVDTEGTQFWDVHAEIEQSHASWTCEALSDLAATPDEVEEWAGRSAAAWWSFLDEREAALAS